MRRKLLLILLSVACILCLAFGLTACKNDSGNGNQNGIEQGGIITPNPGDENNQNDGEDGGWTLERVYAIAVDLGYNGTLEEFLETIKGKDGVSITNVYFENGKLFVVLSSGDTIDCGIITAEPHAHKFNEGHIIFAPTCEEEGLGYWTCEDCGLSKIEEINTIGHDWDEGIRTEPTCDVDGAIIYTCRNNISHKKIDKIKPTGHSWSTDYFYGAQYHYKRCGICLSASDKELHTFNNDNRCKICGYENKVIAGTEGLEYSLINDGTAYSVTKVGTAEGDEIVIGSYHNGLPVTAIDDGAFKGCTSKSIIIPETIEVIGDYAFAFSKIETLEIPDSIITIGGAVFSGCSDLRSVKLGAQITELQPAFGLDDEMGWVRLQGFFNKCTSLTTLQIPRSIKIIEADTFTGCINLENVYYAGTEKEWEAIDIGSTKLKSVNIYYYSEKYPYVDGVTAGNFWHEVNGVPTIWTKEQ